MSTNRNEGRFESPDGAANVPAEVIEQIQKTQVATQQVESENGAQASNSFFSYTMPTEFVDLPSKGKYYDQNHPLRNCEAVEIRYMTAKDEDILSSPALIRKGVAIDRLIENILVDKRIKVESLLVGDKNALVVAARANGYGDLYETMVKCPRCGTSSNFSFSLSHGVSSQGGAEALRSEGVEIEETQNGTFTLTLPRMQVQVEVKLLTGKEEQIISKLLTSKTARKNESMLTTQLKTFIVSVNGHTGQQAIEMLVHNMPAQDSRFLRQNYQKLAPNIDLTQEFICSTCDFEQDMEVPFNTDFFWPKA